jgi:hypothetical protein
MTVKDIKNIKGSLELVMNPKTQLLMKDVGRVVVHTHLLENQAKTLTKELSGYISKTVDVLDQLSVTIGNIRKYYKKSERSEEINGFKVLDEMYGLIGKSFKSWGVHMKDFE